MIQIPPPSTNNIASTWYLNGTQPISGDSLPDHDEVSLVIDFEGRNLVFESDAALRAWAIDDRANRGEFIEKLDEIAYWQDYARQRGILDDSAATDAFADSLCRDAGVEQKGLVFRGVLMLYEGYSLGFRSFFVPTSLPSLWGFNNRASSGQTFFPRTAVLCELRWFRGTKRWFSNPLGQIINDFRFIDFDNRTSSAI